MLRKRSKGWRLSHPNSKQHTPIMVLIVVGFLVLIPLEGTLPELDWEEKEFALQTFNERMFGNSQCIME